MRVTNQPVKAAERRTSPPKPRRARRRRRLAAAAAALLAALVLWLAATAPLSRSLQPIAEPSITLLAADGTPIARRGAIVDRPVRVAELPPHVAQAFLAIEDRRFYSHPGIDPLGLARAAWSNVGAGGVEQGGSTVTQQLAKLAFLDSRRTVGRKLREAAISVWLELWLSKDEILSRYLSSVYFGDNVYGLRAAARHYFDRSPETLTVGQAAMLAGLVKAPSRLAPTKNPQGARRRAALVTAAMVRSGFLTEAARNALPEPRVVARRRARLPTGTYFADWIFAQLDARDDDAVTRRVLRTTLDPRLQSLAGRTAARADIGDAQVALVAMRPDGRVVAMAGGRDYRASPFNRATQARRQPGSTFKLFVYIAALTKGFRPETPVRDEPVVLDGWSPANADGIYRGTVALRDAFAESSNVAAVRIADRIGRDEVAKVARRLGVASPIGEEPSMALGTSAMTLIELTGAFAGVASNAFPVTPRGFDAPPEDAPEPKWSLDGKVAPMILDLLWSSANVGTGRAAALPVPTFGKTGTTQDNRDALFVGFAGDLVVGIWIGNDDNRPLDGLTGGGVAAQLWRDFMAAALNLEAPRLTPPQQVRAQLPQAPPPARAERPRGGKEAKAERRKDKKGKGRGKGARKKRGKGKKD